MIDPVGPVPPKRPEQQPPIHPASGSSQIFGAASTPDPFAEKLQEFLGKQGVVKMMMEQLKQLGTQIDKETKQIIQKRKEDQRRAEGKD